MKENLKKIFFWIGVLSTSCVIGVCFAAWSMTMAWDYSVHQDLFHAIFGRYLYEWQELGWKL